MSNQKKVKGLGSMPARIDFSKEEEKILAHWKKTDAFQESLRRNKGKPPFSFYDGPPFATGVPHYGHILAGTIKDIVCRYAHMTGHSVERRFGWDTHGLPIEFAINEKYDLKTREEVEGPDGIGIPEYNKRCRGIVQMYAKEWRYTIGRFGRWIDFDNDYKTMDVSYMESVWWVFKQLFEKKMVFRDFCVMPYSYACSTPLSLFEAKSNYMKRVDPAVLVSFPLQDEPDVAFLAWTTTPWTLPSHLALAVHPDLEYVRIQDEKSGGVYILGATRLVELYKKPEDGVTHKVLQAGIRGRELEGKRYRPPFNFFADFGAANNAFRVILADYVTDDSGSSIVHQAPAFGEDDYKACKQAGIIKEGGELPCPVDADGRFMSPVEEWKGQLVFDANASIVRALQKSGRLVRRSEFVHSYPYCWRSDKPLIYKAVGSWFVRMSDDFKGHLMKNILPGIKWGTPQVENRFRELISGAPHWNVSRNRFWGTPLPLWTSEKFEEIICIGSIDELEKLSGVRVNDLHRESVDGITIKSPNGTGRTLRRVEEVFDCWFESGSMPYGQVHYPFENKEKFEASFPADFIAEGIDQTRGWFNKLVVLGASLFDKPAFRNVVVNGMVLAEDGKKMSKRLKNYPPPLKVVGAYGADAVRLYLITSPVVRGDSLRFSEPGVREVLRSVMVPWFNAYRFLVQAVADLRDEEDGVEFRAQRELAEKSEQFMDRWVLAALNSLVKRVHEEMKAYRLYTVCPLLVSFIEQLTKWYIRFSRERLRGREGRQPQLAALNTLYLVLYTLNVAMAPLAPFFTEYLYLHMRDALPEKEQEDSVHFLPFPDVCEKLLNEEIVKCVDVMQQVITLGRAIRDRYTKPVKCPLKYMQVFFSNEEDLALVESVREAILKELNVREMALTTDRSRLVRSLEITNMKIFGPLVRRDRGKVLAAMEKLTLVQLDEFAKNGKLNVAGYEITSEFAEVESKFSTEEGSSNPDDQFVSGTSENLLVVLNLAEDLQLYEEYTLREIHSRIQRLRKDAGVIPTDPLEVFFKVDPKTSPFASHVLATRLDALCKSVKQPVFSHIYQPYGARPLAESHTTVPGKANDMEKIYLAVYPRMLVAGCKALGQPLGNQTQLLLNAGADHTFHLDRVSKGPMKVFVDHQPVTLELGKTVFYGVQDRVQAEKNN